LSEQNPVFIPWPTNIPDVFHKACDIVSMDHRSSKLQEKFFASDIWGFWRMWWLRPESPLLKWRWLIWVFRLRSVQEF